MEYKFIIEKFEDYLASHYSQINEAEGSETGFLAVLGSTDATNLGNVVAPEIGIKTDTLYSITIKGEKDLITLGKNKKYSGFAGLKESGKTKAQEDSISIKTSKSSAEIKSAVSAKGNITVDFDKSGTIEVVASNNGLLAFLRACSAMEKACEGKTSFTTGSWIGKMIISMGNPPSKDTSRNSSYLAVNPNITGSNNVRITDFSEVINKGNNKGALTKYLGESVKFDLANVLFEEEGKETPETPKADNIKVIGDTIADAFRAAQHYNATGRGYVNKFGAYLAFTDAFDAYRKTVGEEEWKKAKKINKVSYILAVLLQQIFKNISSSYPMDFKNQDLVPKCKEILTSWGDKEENKNITNLGDGEKILKDMIAFYKPTKYQKIPAFDPVLDGFWTALTNAIASRTAITFKANVGDPVKSMTAAKKVETEGKEKSGEEKNVSGGVK